MVFTRNLLEILNGKDAVLFDTNIYCGRPMNMSYIDRTRSPEFYLSLIGFYEKIEELHNQFGNIYFPKLIAREFLDNGSYPYKRLIKSTVIQNGKIERDNLKNREKANQKARKFLRSLEEEGKILDFDSEKDTTYQYLKSLMGDLPLKHEISLTDLDFLLSGAALASDGLDVTLLSNDFGIVRAWNTLICRTGIPSERLEFYIMLNNKSFKQMKVKK